MIKNFVMPDFLKNIDAEITVTEKRKLKSDARAKRAFTML